MKLTLKQSEMFADLICDTVELFCTQVLNYDHKQGSIFPKELKELLKKGVDCMPTDEGEY